MSSPAGECTNRAIDDPGIRDSDGEHARSATTPSNARSGALGSIAPVGGIFRRRLATGRRLPRGLGSRQRAARQAYVDAIVDSLPIIAYDRGVAVEHAELLAFVRGQGRPRGAHDLLIAATARATHRTIVTADHGAFADLPGVATVGRR